VKEGFESVYDHIEGDRMNPTYFDDQLSFILREAIDPKMKTREYDLEKNDVFRKVCISGNIVSR
jgi:hypothetical protein